MDIYLIKKKNKKTTLVKNRWHKIDEKPRFCISQKATITNPTESHNKTTQKESN